MPGDRGEQACGMVTVYQAIGSPRSEIIPRAFRLKRPSKASEPVLIAGSTDRHDLARASERVEGGHGQPSGANLDSDARRKLAESVFLREIPGAATRMTRGTGFRGLGHLCIVRGVEVGCGGQPKDELA
jgi:hypothetical protein